MKKQNDLLKEAIADADAIKKLAVENAKASLNQAFDSKIKSMLAARLQEEAEEGEEEESKSTPESKEKLHSEAMEESSDTLNEASTQNDDEEDDNEGPMDEIDINKILAEMEDEDDEEWDKEGGNKKDELDEMEESSGYDEAKGDDEEEDENYDHMEESGKKGSDPEDEKEKEDEDVNLEELLRELDEASDDEDEEESSKSVKKEANRKSHDDEREMPKHGKDSEWKEKAEAYRSELNETRKLAATLTKKVNETNLINAKLLYLNKILNKHNLNESQKVRVISAFDRANSVKEAKIVFESLNEAFVVKTQKTKTNLKESLGFASKAAGNSTKRDIITEADDQVARWQKLAGINKK